jgi:hypothetical protein
MRSLLGTIFGLILWSIALPFYIILFFIIFVLSIFIILAQFFGHKLPHKENGIQTGYFQFFKLHKFDKKD